MGVRAQQLSRRVALAASLALASLTLAVAPAAAAPPQEDWVGWGIHVGFLSTGPVVDYTVYAGRDAVGTKPTKIVASLTSTLPQGSCTDDGDITYRNGFAEFPGGTAG